MDAAVVEKYGMVIGVSVLIVFMFFIIVDLGRRSGAGKFGLVILLLGLGVGMLGFVIKGVLTYFLDL
ncbi:MAG: DUF2788 domain-containing protein [Alcanivorax sp.]|jgi:hypothetical protein|nr:MAG: hypothetical protein COA68_06075 [Oceanobacter sp.]|tara:strand:- start:13715 stop:13915 length:201 start_codon:yes stop_codon:yes gene_type:complete